jgi:glycosyltransferase involved in cell wall biosynthesis
MFDDQVFSFAWRGGIARYFTELISLFRSTPGFDVDPLSPFRYTVTAHLQEAWPEEFRRPPSEWIARHPRWLRRLNRVSAWPADAAELLHHTYYYADALRLPARRRVCSIHDMTPELRPDFFPLGNPHADKRRYVDACDAVLCVSQATKEDLFTVYGTVDKPVFVTPLGASDEFFNARPRSDDAKILLHIGHRAGYKNFDVVLKALARLAPEHPDISLVCAGPPFTEDEVLDLDRLELSGRVVWRDTPDRDMPNLLISATCLVLPSLYEGFGLPTVEAFAAGCPVIAAETRWATEVGADAAQYFRPYDDEGLATLVDRLVCDPLERARRIEAGRLRGRDFTWRRTAELTRNAYSQLMDAVG